MSRNFITFDLETVPTVCPEVIETIACQVKPPAAMKKAETIAAWEIEQKPSVVHEAISKTALDGAYGHIAVIGAALNHEEPIAFYVDSTMPSDHEVNVISEFFYFVSDAHPLNSMGSVYVGHNIIGFDLVFIMQRAMILGVKIPTVFPVMPKPWDANVFDTMLRWTGGDRHKYVTQDKLSKVLGGAGKGDIDGSKVWPLVSSGKIGLVAEYAKDDVAQARSNFGKMTFGLFANGVI